MRPWILALLLATCSVAHAKPERLSTACQLPLRESRQLTLSAADLQAEVRSFQRLAEETLARRANAITFFAELQRKDAAGEQLTGQDLLQLNKGYAAILDIRAQLWHASTRHECWLDWTPASAEELSVKHSGLLMSLAASLMLYDNYIYGTSLYRNDGALRRLMNKKDTGFDIKRKELDRIYLSMMSPFNRERIRAGLRWFEDNKDVLVSAPPDGLDYVRALIEQSPSYKLVRKVDVFGFAGKLLNFVTTYGFDTVIDTKSTTTFVPSLLFGNAVGLVETRRGKLFNDPEASAVKNDLQAGDILLEKTPFRLTDKLIPGHWGHAAIWIGSPDELKDLGIWDHPLVAQYHPQILQGKRVVEALRYGVTMNTFEHFLNVDDLAILRPPAISKEVRAEVLLHTLRQVGKAYDFNFDVTTTDKIVCSELVFHAYGHMAWPTSTVIGRTTISPDQIAQQAVSGTLTPTVVYHDGTKVASPKEFLASVLGLNVRLEQEHLSW